VIIAEHQAVMLGLSLKAAAQGENIIEEILGYSFSPIKFHLSLLGSLASRRTWRHLAATVGTFRKQGGATGLYNKPNRLQCNRGTGPGP
jgi:hypothetical protein